MLQRVLRIELQCAFPDNGYSPSQITKLCLDGSVPLPVACKFLRPERTPRTRYRCESAPGMTVPETAMNKDCRLIAWKYQIRFAGYVPWGQTIAKPQAMKIAPNLELRFRVARSNGCHHPGTHFGCNYVYHVDSQTARIRDNIAACALIRSEPPESSWGLPPSEGGGRGFESLRARQLSSFAMSLDITIPGAGLLPSLPWPGVRSQLPRYVV